MKGELTTYQIYLTLLGYLVDQNADVEIKSMLLELYKRANKIESEE